MSEFMDSEPAPFFDDDDGLSPFPDANVLGADPAVLEPGGNVNIPPFQAPELANPSVEPDYNNPGPLKEYGPWEKRTTSLPVASTKWDKIPTDNDTGHAPQ